MVTGVILAGGESKRFGGNKLLVDVGGTLVIDRVYNSLEYVSDYIYVSVRNSGQKRILSERVEFVDKDTFGGFIYDYEGCGGPYCGMLAAVLHISDDIIFLPGDVPWINGVTLQRFYDVSKEYGVCAATPIWGNGFLESLLIFIDGEFASSLGEILREYRLSGRPTDFLRISSNFLMIPVFRLTSKPREFVHINTKEDLTNPRLSNPPKGLFSDVIVVDWGSIKDSRLYLALRALRGGRYFEAVNHLYEELGEYISLRIIHLIEHTISDISYVLNIKRKV